MNDHEGQAKSKSLAETSEGLERRGDERRRRRIKPQQPDASVNMDELRELIALLRENGLAELELERENFRVRLKRDVSLTEPDEVDLISSPRTTGETRRAAPTAPRTSSPSSPVAPEHPGARAETAASEDQDLHIIPSPIVGTFYRSASPTAEPFVKIGSRVEAESVVCIIEAMKLMNEIQAETSGEVVKIYVENGQPVEYGQPLFGLKR